MGRGVQYRLLSLVIFAIAALYTKKAIVLSDPITVLALWAILGAFTLLILIPFILPWTEIKKEFSLVKSNIGLYVLVLILFSSMQLFTNLTFQILLVGYSLALFQISSIFSILLGYKYFREKNIVNKIIGTIIMIIGSAIIFSST